MIPSYNKEAQKIVALIKAQNYFDHKRKLQIVCVAILLYFFHGTLVSILLNESFLAAVLVALLYVITNPARGTVLVGLIFLASIVTQSPIIPALTSITGNIFYIMFSAIALVLLIKRLERLVLVWLAVIFILSLQLFATIYWQEPKLMVLPFYFLSALLIASSLKDIELHRYIEWVTNFVLLLLIGGFIGLFYTFMLGGDSIFSFSNEDTRSNGLYLTTFSNWYVRGVIRPSGIYDEPGALSLIVCLIAAIREKINAPRRTTTLILIMGLITLSVAHVFFLLLYMIEISKKSIASSVFKFAVAFSLTYVVIYNSPFKLILDEFLFSRFEIVDGRLAGDNRTALIENSINYLQNIEVLIFGLDSDCIANAEACRQKGFDQFGDNPLGPLVLGGITQFFPYYAVIICLFIVSIIKKSPIVFGSALLLLARNEVMSYSYSLIIMIYVILVLNRTYEYRIGRKQLLKYDKI
jgi:hypothetical protein